jgi:hypothetical protein
MAVKHNSAESKYRAHMYHAAQRSIPFLLTFEHGQLTAQPVLPARRIAARSTVKNAFADRVRLNWTVSDACT